MKLISIECDTQHISGRFRKSDCFIFDDGVEKRLVKNEFKTSKSKGFFEAFVTWGVTEVYLKELGYKTFLKLEALGVKVFFVKEASHYDTIKEEDLIQITLENAEDFCSLGHHKKS